MLKLVDSADPKPLDLQLVLENYATREIREMKDWLIRLPRIRLHFAPNNSLTGV
ncbi:hypothetical protein [Kribbella sp. CA-294648]|uniref:hypothetical protein n=1 Tax=Kribbella sp. CA-294648 TaxID=3239948 RepID=UPI003D914DA3